MTSRYVSTHHIRTGTATFASAALGAAIIAARDVADRHMETLSRFSKFDLEVASHHFMVQIRSLQREHEVVPSEAQYLRSAVLGLSALCCMNNIAIDEIDELLEELVEIDQVVLS